MKTATLRSSIQDPNSKIDKLLRDTKGFIGVILLAIAGVLAFIPLLTYVAFAQDLTTKDRIMNRNNTGVILLDRNNTPFFTFYSAHFQDYTPLSSIPVAMQQSVIAAEDREFYSHPGFSLKGMVGAILADTKKGGLSYGGSTITQQLVKNSLLNSKKSFLRKYQEVTLAQELERRHSKNELLEMYLNSVYFGEGAFGVDQASQVYFNKKAQNLDLAEASLLTALLPAPSALSPISGDFQKAKVRQGYVLTQMVEQGYISADQKKQAEEEKLSIQSAKDVFAYKAPHFALMVKDELIQKYGEETIARSGFKVKTSIDLQMQDFAEKTIVDQVTNLKSNRVSNGGAVVEDPKTGEILALVGSKDWNDEKDGKFNVAISLRQPGSAFKPIVYSKALEDRVVTPATILKDEPTTFPEDNDFNSYNFKHGQNLYKPLDYDHKFRGPVTVRRALVNSLNIPAVEVLSKIGIPAALEQAKNLGILTLGDDPSKFGLSLVLGAGEVRLVDLTHAYAAFANQGKQFSPTAILEIQDKTNDKIYEYRPEAKQVLDPGVAYQISSILSDNATRSEVFGTALNISRPAAAKTGTTENYKDAWTIGYTPSLVVGVWVGNNDGTTMDQIAGSLGPAPIWRSLMEKFLAKTSVEKFTPPVDIEEVAICKFNGLRVREATSSAYKEYFLPGTAPNKYCSGVPAPSLSPTALPSSPQPSSTSPAQGGPKEEETTTTTTVEITPTAPTIEPAPTLNSAPVPSSLEPSPTPQKKHKQREGD